MGGEGRCIGWLVDPDFIVEEPLDVQGASPLLLPAILWVATQPDLAAAEVNRSWDSLTQTIVSGRKVMVTRMNSATMEGRLTQITSESISVQVKDQPQTLVRSDVYRVRSADIPRKHTFWGMAIGAAAGIVTSVVTDGQAAHKAHPGEAAALGALFGSGIGAAVGGTLPIGRPLYETDQVLRKGP